MGTCKYNFWRYGRVMTTEQIIARMGGFEALARLTGTNWHATYQWGRIGIPYKHFPRLVAEAKRRGVRGITLERLCNAQAASMGRLNGRGRAA